MEVLQQVWIYDWNKHSAIFEAVDILTQPEIENDPPLF